MRCEGVRCEGVICEGVSCEVCEGCSGSRRAHRWRPAVCSWGWLSPLPGRHWLSPAAPLSAASLVECQWSLGDGEGEEEVEEEEEREGEREWVSPQSAE